jgi:cobalt transporter subunit CbtB
MATITPRAQVGDHIHVPLWAFSVMVLALFGAYLILQENGWLVSRWETIHEFFHDGRHALGFPCH